MDGNRLVKILMPGSYAFSGNGILAFGLWRCYLFLVLTICRLTATIWVVLHS